MRDQDLVLDAIEDAQRILADHIEPGSHRPPETTINMLVFLYSCWIDAKWWPALDMGLRVVK